MNWLIFLIIIGYIIGYLTSGDEPTDFDRFYAEYARPRKRFRFRKNTKYKKNHKNR